MNNFEKLKAMSRTKMAEWLNDYGQYDNSPWQKWFDKHFCSKCESVKATVNDYFGNRECKFAYCELEKKCRYFDDYEDVPDSLEIIKMWLEVEVE